MDSGGVSESLEEAESLETVDSAAADLTITCSTLRLGFSYVRNATKGGGPRADVVDVPLPRCRCGIDPWVTTFFWVGW